MGIACSSQPPAPLIAVNTPRSKILIPADQLSIRTDRRHGYRSRSPSPPPYKDNIRTPYYTPMSSPIAPMGGRRYDTPRYDAGRYNAPRYDIGEYDGGVDPRLASRTNLGGVGAGVGGNGGPGAGYAYDPRVRPAYGGSMPGGYVRPTMDRTVNFDPAPIPGVGAFPNMGTGSPVHATQTSNLRSPRMGMGAGMGMGMGAAPPTYNVPQEKGYEYFPGDPYLDACACKTECGCRTGHKVTYRQRREDGTTAGGTIRYNVTDELGKDCGHGCSRHGRGGRRGGEPGPEDECREAKEEVHGIKYNLAGMQAGMDRLAKEMKKMNRNADPGMVGQGPARPQPFGVPYGSMQQFPPPGYEMGAYGGNALDEMGGFGRGVRAPPQRGGMFSGRMGSRLMGHQPMYGHEPDEDEMRAMTGRQFAEPGHMGQRMEERRRGRRGRGRSRPSFDREDMMSGALNGALSGARVSPYGPDAEDEAAGWEDAADATPDESDIFPRDRSRPQRESPPSGGRGRGNKGRKQGRPKMQQQYSSLSQRGKGQVGTRQAYAEEALEE